MQPGSGGWGPTGGYRCSRCGTFVAYNSSHSCVTYPQPSPPSPYAAPKVTPTTYVSLDSPVLLRIAEALERIAEAVEKPDLKEPMA